MADHVAAQRRGRLARAFVVCLLIGTSVAAGLYGPRIAAAASSPDGWLARAERRFQRLRGFALFRSRGDRAVLRGLDGAPPRRHTAGATAGN
ncbi:MAG TPA: hypothetical protein VHG72_02320 [Polyangia bacterium]|nr:hypothetical protein [Polyangia bacterium]